MFLLIGDLIEALLAAFNGAYERLLTSVDPKVIEETLRLLEELSTSRVVTGVHCGLALSVWIWVSDELELSEEAGAGHWQLFFEAWEVDGLAWNSADVRVLSEPEALHEALHYCLSWVFIMDLRGLLTAKVWDLLDVICLAIEFRIINRMGKSAQILRKLGLELSLNLRRGLLTLVWEMDKSVSILVTSCKPLNFIKWRQILRFFFGNNVLEVFDRWSLNIQLVELLVSIIIKIIGGRWYGSLNIESFSLCNSIGKFLTRSIIQALNATVHWLLHLNEGHLA